jgi:hypothetical protein
MIPSYTTTESSNENIPIVNTMPNNDLSNKKSNMKHVTTRNNKLTRLRSFFFKSSSSASGIQQQTTLPSSSVYNQIPRT